jgi:hypothetical protein
MRRELEGLNIPVVDGLGVCGNQLPLVHVNDVAIAQLVAAHFRDRNFAQLTGICFFKEFLSGRRSGWD